jgi:hypothetical protein
MFLAVVVALGVSVETIDLAGSKGPKVSTLAKCPAWGAEQRGSSRGVLNEVKRNIPTGSTPMMLDFADIDMLQHQAEGLVERTSDRITAKARAKLRALPLGDRHVGEGDLVEMVGFLVGKIRVNAGESANCYLKGAANNDFNVYYAPSPEMPVKRALVAEIIPQSRPKEWTVRRLRQAAGHRVLIMGQLMFDSHHAMSEDSRMSLWEIHPVTRFLICQRPSNDCDPSHEDQWQTLETLAER